MKTYRVLLSISVNDDVMPKAIKEVIIAGLEVGQEANDEALQQGEDADRTLVGASWSVDSIDIDDDAS